MDAFLTGLLKTGAPWGILCAALALAVIGLWKRCNVLADKVYDLAIAQVKINSETQHVLSHVERDVEDISRRFRIDEKLR